MAETEDSMHHDVCIDILNQLGRAYMRGFHLVYADKSLLRSITELPELDLSAKKAYRHIVDKKYTWLKSAVTAIRFHVLITTGSESARDDERVVLNPVDFPDFYYERQINLICENIRDAEYYSIVAKITGSQLNMSSDLHIEYNNDTGNGSNTAQKVEARHQESDNLFLAILDSDRHFGSDNIDEVPTGDTVKAVERYFNENGDAILGRYYMLRYVSEIENLIPLDSVKELKHNLGDIRQLSEDALCWYDMKKGISCKHVRKGEKCQRYWLDQYTGNDNVTHRINDATACAADCRDCKRPMNISTNFGASLLEDILDNKKCKDILFEKNMRGLTHQQRMEWQQIGKLVIDWCCAPPKIRV